MYTDFGLFTCDPVLTRDVVTLFHHLTGYSRSPRFEKLLVAPLNMRTRFIDLIGREAANARDGRPARIVAKVNQLEDGPICEALCAASNAGVPIDLIVRGFCCLRPGIAGLTENIRVRSIIGRFLEHGRVFHFANGSEDPLDGDFLLGSADWMDRNLSRRVEAIAPVEARNLRERLWETLEVQLADLRNAWIMQADGSYVRLHCEQPRAEGCTRRHARHDDEAHEAAQSTLIDRAPGAPGRRHKRFSRRSSHVHRNAHSARTGARGSNTMNQGPAQRTTLRTRSIFISDVHLGFKGCQAQYLLDFLRRVECDTVYLVGDIIDLWALSRSFYWPQAHNDVIRTILGKAKHGTRVDLRARQPRSCLPRPRRSRHGQRGSPARGGAPDG